MATCVAHTRQSVVFGIEGHDTSAISPLIDDFERCLDTISLAMDLVFGAERLEDLANVIVGVVFFESQLGVRPDLLQLSKTVYYSDNDNATYLLVDLTQLGFILVQGPADLLDNFCLSLHWQHVV